MRDPFFWCFVVKISYWSLDDGIQVGYVSEIQIFFAACCLVDRYSIHCSPECSPRRSIPRVSSCVIYACGFCCYCWEDCFLDESIQVGNFSFWSILQPLNIWTKTTITVVRLVVVPTSGIFKAEISVRSPRKLIMFIIQKNLFWMKVFFIFFVENRSTGPNHLKTICIERYSMLCRLIFRTLLAGHKH